MTRRIRGHQGQTVFLEQIPYDAQAWGAIVASHEDAEVFHSAEWLEFLRVSQGAEPVAATVLAEGRPVGHFVGAIVRRLGLKILGSPLRGWSTESMGFLLEPGVDRHAAAEALVHFAFHKLGCLHVELADRQMTSADMTRSGFHAELGQTYRLDLRPSEDEVMGQIRRTTRQEIRKAIRAGLRAEVAEDDRFADEFFSYLTAVFARQGLSPTYGIERVQDLVRKLRPSGQLLLLRVLAPDGRTIGTGISIGRNRTAYAWGMAFDRQDEQHHAIELLWWETIRHWRSRGALMFDFGGGGEYKAKYGGALVETTHFHRSRWAVLRLGRSTVRRLARLTQVAGAGRPRQVAGS